MKKLTTLILISLITTTLFSCIKNERWPNAIQGKWTLKLDSIAQGVSGPSPQYSSDYAGTAADYFDFRSDNKLYIKEGAHLDTFNYTVNSLNNISISPTNAAENGLTSSLNGTINPLNNNSASIHFVPSMISFGLYYSRTVNLTK